MGNFGRSIYLCRYCIMTRQEFYTLFSGNFDDTMRNNNCCTHDGDSEEEQSSDSEESSEEEECFEYEEIYEEEGSSESYDERSDVEESEEEAEIQCTSTDITQTLDYIPVNFGPRTIESYNEALEKMENKKSYQGVEFDSAFNRLKNYHVCLPGLPPCMGHDLPEGIIAYDLMIYIRYFLKKGWFSLELPNLRIDDFPYSARDRKDKSATVPNISASKLVGGAWQLINFIRLLPLIIGHEIDDPTDKVWCCLMRLSEITEIVCSPLIHSSLTTHLQLLINDYLSLRVTLFPKISLRSKHHFLTHYPDLILALGPLIEAFTLRFESKQTFFKRLMRILKNFKNVSMSLATKHELLQSLLRMGAGLRNETSLSEERDFYVHIYAREMKEAVQTKNLLEPVSRCTTAAYRGTAYKPGDMVVLKLHVYQH